VERGRKVAVALRKARYGGAIVLPYPRPAGAAVLLGKGDPRFFHSAEQRGLVDASLRLSHLCPISWEAYGNLPKFTESVILV